ncbi:glycogen/starch synthase [Dactylosporangium sp. NBC_01737]|uniref:glycogen synthase n=1 Tax=Dactylosporangium sp. NBC_01737 TaxID=2975959 RepID=UPI002E14F88C|nr:glycogen/starch synthase [Dactylosporangium sp. NBC_01737]
MRCLFVTQEYAPYFAEGGLGLTSNALPAALAGRHGIEHDLVLPYYPRLVHRLGLRTEAVLELPERAATVHRLLDGTPAGNMYLIRADRWYDRPGIYRDDDYVAFADEAERAAYFGLCVADWVSATAAGSAAHTLVHGNDWQSGAAMAHLRERFPHLPQLLTIHNGLYRGDLRGRDPVVRGLPDRVARRLRDDSRGRPSLLLAGLFVADAAVTCSPTYADELRAPVDGDPMPEALWRLELSGVLFGVDERLWDPAAPGRSSTVYDATTVEQGKRSNKLALQKRLGLPQDDMLPVVGVCSRLVPEKGSDLLVAALAPLLRAGRLQLVLVGPATADVRRQMRGLPGLAHVPGYDQDIAWLTFAGADLTVMPSRVEPGGLNQLIAFRYGTVPVVSPVGGLNDTVADLRRDPDRGTGFVIAEHTVASVRDTVTTALDWMAGDPGRHTELRRRIMADDWSWARTAAHYAAVYSRLSRG